MTYTYLIGWSKHNKWYYGCRFAKKCKPSDLWTTYFTSSKHVKRFRELHGEPDVIEIRKTFEDVDKCRLWEEKVLKRSDVINKEKWLNISNNRQVKHTLETKTKISSRNKGKPKNKPSYTMLQDHEKWIYEISMGIRLIGCRSQINSKQCFYYTEKPTKEETSKKISDRLKSYYSVNHSHWKGAKFSSERLEVHKKAHTGRKHSNATKQKMSESAKRWRKTLVSV